MNIVGDSYTLPDRRASAQRVVNMYLRGMESEGNTRAVLVQFPGLRRVGYAGGVCRGAIEASGRAFAVFGATLYEVTIDGALIVRGSLSTGSGRVGIEEGLSQLVIVDGPYGYVLRLSTNVFSQITSPAWLGSDTVAFLNSRWIFHQPKSQLWYYSAIDDATDLDALDFASAEAAPDDLVAVIADHQEVRLLGSKTTEVFYDAGSLDFAFQRNSGATVAVGALAAHSVRKLDNGLIWLGRDGNGGGAVYKTHGYTPQRASTAAVEAEFAKSTDIEAASAFTMNIGGLMFYILTAPGVETSWAYEASTGRWCELADIAPSGDWQPWRGVAHCYAYGKNHIFGADGWVYTLDAARHFYGLDEVVCERRAPDTVAPMMARRFYGAFVAEIEARDVPQAYAPQVELSWSDDGGYTFGNPVLRSLGLVGERPQRILWARTGSGRDRVWRLRYSGSTGFTLIAAGTQG